MPFDGLVTKKICEEFNQKLLFGKVDKIIQPTKDEIILFIRNNRITYKLLLSSNAQNARIHITEDTSILNPSKPFNFCMVLRKYLLGAKLILISQIDNDRIVNLTFENSNELKDKEIKTLIIEMMGKHSNIILCTPKNIIIDAIKHIDFEISSVREVMPGRTYILPSSKDKINPFLIDENKFNELIKKYDKLSNIFTGICSQINNEELTSYKKFYNFINKEISPVIFLDNLKPVDFYFTPLNNNYTTISFDSISKAVDTYYIEKIKNQKLQTKKNSLQTIINTAQNKIIKKMGIIKEKIETTNEMESLRIKGELLSANIYKLSPFMSNITLENYYDNNNAITIQLDKNLSPSQNIQKIFKKYSKLKNTLTACNIQQEKLKNELAYIESLSFEIQMQTELYDLEEIENEMYKQGFIKIQNTKKKVIKSSYLHFNYKNFDILVGKNNIQNDMLTFSIAKKSDIWFHAKNVPGSHTILKTNNISNVPKDVLEFSASLAAYYSKLRSAPKADIDYTEVKNVKKIPGAKPGMVTYNNFKTLYIQPNDGYSYLLQ